MKRPGEKIRDRIRLAAREGFTSFSGLEKMLHSNVFKQVLSEIV
jgi:hypothetical protein